MNKHLNQYLMTEYRNHYGFIYITTNLVNDKKYIGQKRIDDGSKWMSYLGSGSMILRAISKYGRNNFKRDILEICDTAEELDAREYYWIEKFKAVESQEFYNLIEGGKVSTIISNAIKSPCICINTNRVFKSLKDASVWCNRSPIYIKNSFEKIYHEGLANDGYIFRDLKHVKYKHKLCCICGDSFIPINNAHKYCEYCQDTDLRILKIKLPKVNESIITYSLHDSWVKQFIINNYDGRRNYNKRNKIIKKINTKPKVKAKSKKYITTKGSKKKIIKSLPESVLKLKDKLIHLYVFEKKSINSICNELNLKYLDVKKILEDNDVKIRPPVYINYYQNQKEQYIAVFYNDKLIHIFKYLFEFKYWYENIRKVSITKNRLNEILDKNLKVDGYLFTQVDEVYFKKKIMHYKTIEYLDFNELNT